MVICSNLRISLTCRTSRAGVVASHFVRLWIECDQLAARPAAFAAVALPTGPFQTVPASLCSSRCLVGNSYFLRHSSSDNSSSDGINV